ncbi:DNA-binding transcriptional regulator ume6 [Recurvomyces mirabilis]|uniref:DNA-binding transcriptional regulator ume6 n=1 Tax=Recurvomyces mirabilis TaxID=574656 RepID=A0AAE1C4A7_9PEZI|nr:DNA-binding transcriptional regulator ume6 [Recurvomyces mirabilis]KAK5157357.1 DNA-binding transcriptional regulator ume6 [Recurvomyces mirabilis]
MSKPNVKMAAPKNMTSDAKAAAAAAKMHRRSRSGCFTCRLRRKKCEEGKPACKACKHLGLRCDYKRPMWWSNGEQRRHQKELIKNAIKRTQLSKKSTQVPSAPSCHSPPSLCHSIPTSSEVYQDSFPQSRAPSVGSPFSSGCDYPYASPEGYFAMPPPPQPMISHPQYPMFSPYEVDIKTERQIYINGEQTRRDSTVSTFSTYQPPPLPNGMPAFPADSWIQQEYFESNTESLTEEPVDFNFFEYPHEPPTPEHETVISVDDCDKYLLSHFFDKVLKLIFPILEVNQHGSARSDVILPALESNKAYLHCCLSIAATHKKAAESIESEQLDNDIVRHRYAAISELCEALGRDEKHSQILEATLGMIFFQCSVGRADDALPDIPWHQHFQAAISLVNKLSLPEAVMDLAASGHAHPPFNMALTAWIDILGASMIGRSPVFADTYRELNMGGRTGGLAELMGCEDNVMFLISEIACLDVQKSEGLDEVVLCKYVEVLAHELGQTEPPQGTVQNCFSATGAIRPRQLSANISAVFRVAARIYLCSLVPGYEPRQPSTCHLVSQFSDLMNFIPAGPDGFDRSLAWPLLIAGSASVAASPFRSMFEERCKRLGDAADFGSLGRVGGLLKDVWQANKDTFAKGDHRGVRWRDVMQQKGWDYLLI